MKRLICLCLVLSFLLLTGCSLTGERIKEPVAFYYVREGYEKEMDPVIGSEIREASGHSRDLPYLLALYSMGPSQEDLKAVLPRNTRILLTEQTEEDLVLTLSEEALRVTEADFTLAGTCLAMTCMELTDTPQVTVVCEERTVTIRKDNLLLHHALTENSQEDIK